MTTRRRLLRTAGTTLTATALGGCTSSTNDDSPTERDPDIVVGPRNELSFDPDSLTVSTDEELTWYFASSSHNVSFNPDHSDAVRLPADAEPFASYDGDDKYVTDEKGATFSHTFITPERTSTSASPTR